MGDIILIVLFICGKPDTILVKYPDSEQVIMSHRVDHPQIREDLAKILATSPIIIQYEDERSTCA